MLRQAARIISKQVEEADRLFFVGHNLENTRAINCSKRAGFVYRCKFIEKGFTSALYVRNEQLNNA